MTLRFLILLIFSNFSFSAISAGDSDISAYRDPKIPFESYEELMNETEKFSPFDRASAIGSAQYYTGANLPAATSWPSVGILQSRFSSVRNDRYIKWARDPNFTRRISWLYPNDGCYARATMANRWFKGHGMAIPSKVFAFGKLRVSTANHPRGTASWWYHVAPIVQVGETKYVLDPSIDASKPLPLIDWLARMGTPGEIKVAICGSGTHSPKSDCGNNTVGSSTISSQQTFLSREWDQLKRMGRDPETLLGGSPPWKR